MRTLAKLAIIHVASVAISTIAHGQVRTSDETTVLALDDQARIAALNRDIPALERLWSEDMVVNAPNNEVVVGRRAVIDGFVRAGVINFSSFERQVEFIRVDGDFATIMGLETVRPIADAAASGLKAGQIVQRRVTNIWRREGDTWRLFIRHANVIPARP
jgi:ketosteroid isomerase-like protein